MEHLLHRRLLCVVARQQVVVELRQGTVASGHPGDLRLDRRAAGVGFRPRWPFGLRVIGRPENIRELAIVLFEGQLPPVLIGELVPGLTPG